MGGYWNDLERHHGGATATQLKLILDLKSMFRAMLWVFRGNDRGQDLADYCLLTALIALIALGIICHVSGGIQGLWSSTGAMLATANSTTVVDGTAGASTATNSQAPGR